MFYKRNGNRKRRPSAPEVTLSPRAARLVRESWCLLVAAVLIYVALILFTYTKSDRGFSFTGTSDTIANRGGVVGAWLSDLLLYLFGLSAWWWVGGGLMLLIAGFRRIADPDRVREHPMGLAAFGFALVLLSSAAIEAIRLWKLPAVLPLAPGGAFGDSIGDALARAFGFNGATLLLLAAFAIGCSLLFGVSWLKVMERVGAVLESLYRRSRERRERAGRGRGGSDLGSRRRTPRTGTGSSHR
jgi:S-DNA-T family DNA segregation ATPase FtsK/SpoIIIE